MAYQIEVKPSAVEALAKIPQPHRNRIARKIGHLGNNPRPRGAVKLEGKPAFYRVRVGEYRILYDIQDQRLLVLVVRIGNRRDVYRNLP